MYLLIVHEVGFCCRIGGIILLEHCEYAEALVFGLQFVGSHHTSGITGTGGTSGVGVKCHSLRSSLLGGPSLQDVIFTCAGCQR